MERAQIHRLQDSPSLMPENLRPRIALIHALEESIAPIRAAFAQIWPEAATFDLLDTSLAPDRALAGHCNSGITRRFQALGRYVADHPGGAGPTRAVLFTCSAFGPAIDAVKADLAIPVFKPNEAAFREGLAIGPRIGLCVTFKPSLASLSAELEAEAARSGTALSITPILASGALAALKAGDGEAHDAAVRQACAGLRDLDVLILGQFSLARAAPGLADLPFPILTTPGSAVRVLRDLIAPHKPDHPIRAGDRRPGRHFPSSSSP